jgi:membrane protein DedA with SNARE-associated domain
LDWIAHIVRLIGYWNYGLVALSGIAESLPIVGVVFPGQNIVIIVGTFFGKHHMYSLIAIATLGVYVGHQIGYWLGEKYGISLIDEYGPSIGFGKTEVKYLEDQILKRGGVFMILGTFHNITRAFVPFIAGSMKMDKRRFALYNFIGSLLWAVTIIVLGVMFGHYYEIILKKLPWILGGLMVLIIAYIILFKKKEFIQYLEEKEKENEESKGMKK